MKINYVQGLITQRNNAQLSLMLCNNDIQRKLLETRITVLNCMLNELQGKKLDVKA